MNNDKKDGADLAIPAILSAALNIATAKGDASKALECWGKDGWTDCVMWINIAIAQLESARAKILAHGGFPDQQA